MDDLGFVRQCLTKSPQAWSEFIDRYARLIYSYIHAILKIKGITFSQENIDDLFQEFFLHLRRDNFKKLRNFSARNGSSLASWLKAVVVNFTIDYVRKTKEFISLEEELGDDLMLKDVVRDEKPSARDKVFAQEKIDKLKECISQLEQADRYFLELYLNRHIELEDLKEALRISRAAVDMRKKRILERLRDCFKKKGFVLDS